MATNGASRIGRRAAIVAGLRTPFVKAGGDFRDLGAVDLGAAVVNELVARAGIPVRDYDAVVFGQVIPSQLATLIAREVVLRTQLPKSVEAHTVSRACATSIQATTDAADQIALGHAEVVLAGRRRVALRRAHLRLPPARAGARERVARARAPVDKAKAFGGLSLKDLTPVPPALTEPTTGLTMGESAEKMAQMNGISRAAQDEFAYLSHRRAAEAWREGKFDDEVMHVAVPPRYERIAAKDNIVRDDTTLEALAQLRPVFDREYGTVTAGNSSPLTDGAAALVLMSEEKAKRARATSRSATCAPTPTRRSIRAISCCRVPPTRRRSRSIAPG